MIRQIEKIVSYSPQLLTPKRLEGLLNARSLPEKKAVREAVRALVDQGILQYTSRFGSAFLEPSIQGVLRISENLLLKPPQSPYSPQPGETVVSIGQGSAFGLGDHASTRLALKGIERAIRVDPGWKTCGEREILDIGTGTGVLMISALLLGIGSAVGIDTDPAARFEAMENAKINGVAHRIVVTNDSVNTLKGPFILVAANLRYPTLAALAPKIQHLLSFSGAAVFSGIRKQELEKMKLSFSRAAFSLSWEDTEKEWWGALFIKKAR